MALKFRRGTTAQQSGSLAFGEPFVNTTLGTLLVGGANGDIQLATIGTGSTGTFGDISGSGLDITGNARIGGNLTLGGNITIGDATTDLLAINADLSSSLIPDVSNTIDLGSTSKLYRNVYATSISGAIAATNGVVSGSSQIISILTPLNTFSGSQLTQNSTLATYTGSVDTRLTTIGTVTASFETRATSLATITGSLITTASNLTQRVAANEAVSGTFARTNSANIFTGTQTITGSLYVSQDLVVAGSSSIQNISSSNLVIGAAYVTLNTNTPSSRYAGLQIVDSGSAGISGSFLYDAVQDEFIFVHKGNGTNVTSSHFVMGPETFDNLGNESYLTNNKLVKGTGKEHIVDSTITDDGTTVSIANNIDITGSIKAPQLNAIATITGSLISSASVDQTRFTTIATLTGSYDTRFATLGTYTASVDTRFTTLATTSGSYETRFTTLATTSGSLQTSVTNLNTFSASALTRLSSLEVETSNLETYTSSFAAASVTLTNKTISGASNTLSNIANASLTNSSVTVTAGTGLSGGGAVSLGSSVTLTNAGVTSAVAGTGVSVSGATGAVTISIGQAVATSSSPTFAGLTINGAITATGDITAYFTSDKRHKNNIQTISNAVLKVKQLNGVTWEWNDDVNEVTKSTPKTGLIAQEVQQVLPQVVIEKADGYLGLDYSKMMGLMVEAIKEQQIQIDNLTIQVENLKRQRGL